MKKWIALLLAVLLMLTACMSMAEEAATVDFDIKLDKVPDGYACTVSEAGGSLLAVFRSTNDENAPLIQVAVAFSDEFEGFTLNADLTEEQYANMTALLTQDYLNPTIEVRETEYGTKVIFISEDGAESDYMDAVTVWNGYFITMGILKNTEVTDDDLALATGIIADMWVVTE